MDVSYNGRGFIQGLSGDGQHHVQLYWLTGRSENSRNRYLRLDEYQNVFSDSITGEISNRPLTIYHAMHSVDGAHIVSNGQHTLDVVADISNRVYDINMSFIHSVLAQEYEPDPPHYTPRITGMIHDNTYIFGIAKKTGHNIYVKTVDKEITPGVGYCITTYMDDGNPLPSFEGEPYMVKIVDDLEYYWNLLNKTNRIAIVRKKINLYTGEISFDIINREEP